MSSFPENTPRPETRPWGACDNWPKCKATVLRGSMGSKLCIKCTTTAKFASAKANIEAEVEAEKQTAQSRDQTRNSTHLLYMRKITSNVRDQKNERNLATNHAKNSRPEPSTYRTSLSGKHATLGEKRKHDQVFSTSEIHNRRRHSSLASGTLQPGYSPSEKYISHNRVWGTNKFPRDDDGEDSDDEIPHMNTVIEPRHKVRNSKRTAEEAELSSGISENISPVMRSSTQRISESFAKRRKLVQLAATRDHVQDSKTRIHAQERPTLRLPSPIPAAFPLLTLDGRLRAKGFDESILDSLLCPESGQAALADLETLQEATDELNLTKTQLARQKVRAALDLPAEPTLSTKTNKNAPMSDKEITFTAALSTQEKGTVFTSEHIDDETTIEAYIDDFRNKMCMDDAVVPDESHTHTQAEIKARGGRKGQFGKVLTKATFEDRWAKGWGTHQTKIISEKDKIRTQAMARFFGLAEEMQPIIFDGKLAMADSALFQEGRIPLKEELKHGINVW
jgi:hypothetical protein